MEPMPKLDRVAYSADLREQLETLLDLFAEFRRKAYEVGLRMRTDAVEAAFSPPAKAGSVSRSPLLQILVPK